MKKKAARISTLALSFVLAGSSVPISALAVEQVYFSDIANHWSRQTVEKWAEEGVVNGYPDGSFQPDNLISRAEFGVWVNHILGYDTSDVATGFADVKGHWAESIIAALVEHGVILPSEYGENYEPDKEITRMEMLKMMVRAIEKDGEVESAQKETAYADNATFHEGDCGWINTASAYSVVAGYPDGTLKPYDNATRAEGATMMLRLQRAVEEVLTDTDKEDANKKNENHKNHSSGGSSSGGSSSGGSSSGGSSSGGSSSGGSSSGGSSSGGSSSGGSSSGGSSSEGSSSDKDTIIPIDRDGDGAADGSVDASDVIDGVYTDPETGDKYKDISSPADGVLDPVVPIDKDGNGTIDDYISKKDVIDGIYTDSETGNHYKDSNEDGILEPLMVSVKVSVEAVSVEKKADVKVKTVLTNTEGLTVEWTITDAEGNAYTDYTGSLDNSGGTIQFPAIGTYTITAAVTENSGNRHTDSVTVSVQKIQPVMIFRPLSEYVFYAYKDKVKTVTFETDAAIPDAPAYGPWDMSYAGNGSVMAWMDEEYNVTITSNTGDGIPVVANKDSKFLFGAFSALESIDFGENFDTSNVRNMQLMFAGCQSLSSLNVSGFDTSNVTSMECMFSGCQSLSCLDVSGFDTSNVTNMDDMFYRCYNLSSLNVSGFDTSNVTGMNGMFEDCKNLNSLDVSGFDTSNVTSMYCMFSNCGALTGVDVSGFDTNSVTNMNKMFYGCKNLNSLDVSGFDTSNVTNMNEMFYGCESLTSLNVSGFDTGNVTSMECMFSGCKNLNSLDVSRFDTSNVTSMYCMFSGCKNLNSLDVSGFDTSNVTSMYYMFSGCQSLSGLDVGGFNTSNVKHMSGMFNGCESLSSLNVSGFDTSNVTSIRAMFSGCKNLNSLDVSGFDTSNVTDMWRMFYGCESLTSLNVSGFDTGNVTSMVYMFSGCKNLSSLDVSGFDTSNVTGMGYMFYGCQSLSCLDVSGFDTSNVKHMDDMFYECYNLESVTLGTDWDRIVYSDYDNPFHMWKSSQTIYVQGKASQDDFVEVSGNNWFGNATVVYQPDAGKAAYLNFFDEPEDFDNDVDTDDREEYFINEVVDSKEDFNGADSIDAEEEELTDGNELAEEAEKFGFFEEGIVQTQNV